MNLGERIRVLRAFNSLRQEDLGNKVRCPRNTISRWESERTLKIPHYTIGRMAKALGVTPAYLMFGDERIESACWRFTVDPRVSKTPNYCILINNFLLENGVTEALVAQELADGGALWLFTNGSPPGNYPLAMVCDPRATVIMEKWVRSIPVRKADLDLAHFDSDTLHTSLLRKNGVARKLLRVQGISVGKSEVATQAGRSREKDLETALRTLVEGCLNINGVIRKPTTAVIVNALDVLGLKKRGNRLEAK